jgi:hypothetical protein
MSGGCSYILNKVAGKDEVCFLCLDGALVKQAHFLVEGAKRQRDVNALLLSALFSMSEALNSDLRRID